MSRARLLLVMSLGACGFNVTLEDVDAGIVEPMPDACVTFSSLFDTCLYPAGNNLVLSGATAFDTATTRLSSAGGELDVTAAVVNIDGSPLEVVAIFVHDITIRGVLRASGARAFAIVASGTVSIEAGGLVEVGAGGAGGQVACASPAEAGTNDLGGASGGGGGGFGGAGARGGNGNSDRIGGSIEGGDGGGITGRPAGVLGGCPGAKGGDGDNPGGAGGLPGGAVFIVARESISIAASTGVNAGGGGGAGGTRVTEDGDAGGGGGGTGGMILLEAPRIVGAGLVSANGGGGGEGSGNSAAGNAGASATLGVTRAAGGDLGTPTGSSGGDGGNGANANGGNPGGAQQGGGGGGGGSAGYVRVISASNELPAANISPGT